MNFKIFFFLVYFISEILYSNNTCPFLEIKFDFILKPLAFSVMVNTEI